MTSTILATLPTVVFVNPICHVRWRLESVFVIVERGVISIRGHGRSYFPFFSYNSGKAREGEFFPENTGPSGISYQDSAKNNSLHISV